MDSPQNIIENKTPDSSAPVSPVHSKKKEVMANEEYTTFSKQVISITVVAVVIVLVTESVFFTFVPATLFPVVNVVMIILGAIGADWFILRSFKKNVALRVEVEQRFQTIIENIPDVVYTADINGITKFVSPSVEKTTGYTVEEFLSDNRNWLGGIHPDDVQKGTEALKALFEKHTYFDIEYRYKTKDGRWIWVHDRSNKVYERDGVMYTDGVFSDITRQKEANERIHLQSQLLDAVSHSIIYTNLQGSIIYWNKYAEELYGWTENEVIGKNIIDITPSQITKDQAMEIMQTLQNNQSWKGEFVVKRKDGTEFSAYVVDNPFFDEHKKIVGIIGSSMDISDRKKTEQQLKQRTQELEEKQVATSKLLADISARKIEIEQEKLKADAILENIGEGLIVTDGEGRILLANKASEALLGWTSEEMQNAFYLDIIRVLDKDKKVVPDKDRPIVLALSKGTKISGLYFYKRRDNNYFPVALTVTPLSQNNTIIGGVLIFRDITREYEVNKAKSEFVSLASHELKTPLGIMKWYMESIKDDESFNNLPAQTKEYLEDIYKSNERVLGLVRDLLDISRIDEGRVKDDPKQTDVVQTVQKTIADLKLNLDKKSLVINVDLQEPSLPAIVIDARRFGEVVENVFTNAIKYSKEGGQIKATISRAGDFVKIEVADQGIGIPSQDLPQIFNKFFRASNAIKSVTEGTGLGLYVVKSYLESWGGNIIINSEENKGTVVSIQIPLNPKTIKSLI